MVAINMIPPKLPPLPPHVKVGRETGWDPKQSVSRACPVCLVGAGKPFAIRPDGFQVSVCTSCSIYFLAHAPTEEQLTSFYTRYDRFKDLSGSRAPRSNKSLRRDESSDPYIEILRATGGLNCISLCEIGSAHGGFLELAQA